MEISKLIKTCYSRLPSASKFTFAVSSNSKVISISKVLSNLCQRQHTFHFLHHCRIIASAILTFFSYPLFHSDCNLIYFALLTVVIILANHNHHTFANQRRLTQTVITTTFSTTNCQQITGQNSFWQQCQFSASCEMSGTQAPPQFFLLKHYCRHTHTLTLRHQRVSRKVLSNRSQQQ